MFQRFKQKIIATFKKSGFRQALVSLSLLVIVASTLTVLAQTSSKSEPENPISQEAIASTVLLASADQDVSEKLIKDGVKLIANKKASDQTDSKSEQEKESDRTKEKPKPISEQADRSNSSKLNRKSPNKKMASGGEKDENEFFTTSIVDQESVNTERYHFKIYQKKHDYKVKKEEVSVNNEELFVFKNQVDLKVGENTLQVVVTYQEKDGSTFNVSKKYRVMYQDKLMIKTNLSEISEIKQPELNFTATGHRGSKQLDLVILVNGKKQKTTQKSDHQFKLKEGQNTIELILKDQGQELKASYSIRYIKDQEATVDSSTTDQSEAPEESQEPETSSEPEVSEEPEELLTATISVEATTVGRGYLIAPTQVEFKKGTKLSYIVTDLLTKHKFDYQHSGTLDSSFYLRHIIASNGDIWNGIKPKIDPLIEQRMLDEGSEYNPTNYEINSLGEMDFSQGSGWVYEVDGVYPEYGMTEMILTGEEIVEVRFTLMYGSDVDGSNNSGEGDYGDG